MAVTATLYDLFRKKLLTGANPIVFGSDNIYVALVTDSYSPDRAADEFWDVPQAYEITGDEYVTDGALLASKVIAVDGTGHYGVLTAADVTWAASTITAHYAVLYCKKSTAATSPLIGYIDFGTDESTVATDFKLTFPNAAAGGVLKV